MNKLYGLYYVPDENSWAKMLCASNDYDKLTSVSTNTEWYVGSNDTHNSPGMVRHSEGGVYPMWWVQEIPYVC